MLIILTIESAVNNPDDFSSIEIALSNNSIDWNIVFLFLFSTRLFSFPFSITVIESVYIHTNLFLSWYFIFVINLPPSPWYVFSNEFVGSELAFSTDITFIFDWIILPEVSTSAIAKYLLSFDILTSAVLVDDK